MHAPLIDERKRRRKVEGRGLEIEGAPPSRRNVPVPSAVNESGGQEISRAAPPEIPDGGACVGERQMHQPVAADDQVCPRQFVAGHVQTTELPIRRSEQAGIAGDQFLDDIDSRIDHVPLRDDVAHPVEIAAWCVENRPDVPGLQHRHELLLEIGSPRLS